MDAFLSVKSMEEFLSASLTHHKLTTPALSHLDREKPCLTIGMFYIVTIGIIVVIVVIVGIMVVIVVIMVDIVVLVVIEVIV